MSSYKNFASHFKNKSYTLSVVTAFVFLFISFILNFYAGLYAAKNASNHVTDIILSNIPVFDVSAIFAYGPFLMWFFVAYLGFKEPQKVPFVVKSIALFVIIRSGFIMLTHLGPFPTQIPIDNYGAAVLEKFTLGADLFFSAHTGLPFLMALVFWDNRKLRNFFIILAIMFGAVVLMGHLHYSIDVASAFFITYSIYRLSQIFFPKDYKIFYSGIYSQK